MNYEDPFVKISPESISRKNGSLAVYPEMISAVSVGFEYSPDWKWNTMWFAFLFISAPLIVLSLFSAFGQFKHFIPLPLGVVLALVIIGSFFKLQRALMQAKPKVYSLNLYGNGSVMPLVLVDSKDASYIDYVKQQAEDAIKIAHHGVLARNSPGTQGKGVLA